MRVENARLNVIKRVGVAGFEPTTPSTPRKYATRLRYTPIHEIIC